MNQLTQHSQSYPLTTTQRQMWYGQSMHPDRPLYNMAHVFRINGKLDTDIFQQAFQKMLDRSDSMRTIVRPDSDDAIQIVRPTYEYELGVMQAESDEQVESILDQRKVIILRLEERLFDSVLIKRSDTEYYWYLNLHHLICDAWSIWLIYNEVSSIYKDLMQDGQSDASDDQMVRYQEFVSMDRNGSNSKSTWRSGSSESPSSVQLFGLAKARSSDTQNNRFYHQVDRDVLDKIDDLLNEPDFRAMTKHIGRLGFFSSIILTLIHKLSGVTNVNLITPMHNRSSAKLKKMHGNLIEMYPVGIKMNANDSFGDIYKRCQGEIMTLLKHAGPGKSNPELLKNINVVLNYLHLEYNDFAGIPSHFRWLHSGHVDENHDLRIVISDFNQTGALDIYFEISDHIVSANLQQSIIDGFSKLIDQVISQPNSALIKLAVDNEQKLKLKTAAMSGSTKPYTHQDLITIIRKSCETYPDKIALICNDEQYSYGELDAWSDDIAKKLRQTNETSSSIVGIHLNRSPLLIASILGIWKAGAAYVPIPIDTPKEKVSYIINTANISQLISKTEIIDSTQGQLKVIDSSSLAFDEDSSSHYHGEAGHLAYIMFTSGSTGQPKGVQISHAALANYIHWAADYYPVNCDTQSAFFSSVGFDLTVTSMFLPLALGGSVHIYPEDQSMDADLAIVDVIKNEQVNFIKMTPSHLSLLDKDGFRNTALRTIILGGEQLTYQHVADLRSNIAANAKIYNEYGPTEATVGTVVYEVNTTSDHMLGNVPIGRPIANTDLLILDEFGGQSPLNVPGQLYIAGGSLSDGYVVDHELTSTAFQNIDHKRYYRTGDLAKLRDDGELEYLSRIDTQLKIDGRRIEPAEIEQAMASIDGITAAIVQLRPIDGIEETSSKPRLVAFYTGDKIDRSDIQTALTDKLPAYMTPSLFHHLEGFPLTANGKLDTKALGEIDMTASSTGIDESRDEFEDIVYSVYQEILGHQDMRLTDQFIHLGGASLDAIRIASRLTEAFELKITVDKIFRYPSIKSLSAYVKTTIIELLNAQSE